MKMKKLMCVLTGICLASFVAGLAMAEGTPSAKFAATWSEDITLGSVADTGNVTAGTSIIIDDDAGVTLTKIKVPQDKELLVGVSAEIGILTDTSIRGKNGGNAKALAGGAAWVTIVAEPVNGGDYVEAEPGAVILSGRIQELEATLGGVIESCPVTCNEEWDNGVVVDVNCEDIVVAEDCVVTDEEIALLQATASANHFNFLLPDMDAGVYEIKAYFTTTAVAGVDVCDAADGCDGEITAEASAYAVAVVGKTMLTVQQVRAAKDTLDETDIDVQ
jgi:hypothetical protein